MADASFSGSAPYDQRIARIAARGLARTPVRPNGVTGASMVVGCAAAVLLSMGSVYAGIGAGVFVIAAWMDHVDGELARMTNTTSIFGHYFDHVAAMTNYVAMFVGAGIGLREAALEHWMIVLGVAAGLGVASIMSFRMVIESRLGRSSVRQQVKGGFEIEDTLYVVAPVTWIGGLEYFIVLAGVGAPVFLIYVVWDGLRQLRHTREMTTG